MGRRRLATGLPIVVMAALLTGVAWGERNVARDRPFTCSTGILEGWVGLVDGVVDSDSAPGCFATSNENVFPKHVTVDLQVPHDINRIAVHNSSNGNTRGIIISCSLDGENYEQLREFIFPQGEAITLNHRFNDRPAQFVRIEFTNTWGGGLGGDHTIFIREVEVFGTPTGAAGVQPQVAEPRGDALVKTRDLRLFRRWAIDGNSELKIAVLGDSFADAGEESWPQEVAERLAIPRPEGSEIVVASLMEEGATPQLSAESVSLVAEGGFDAVFVTFGSDMGEWNSERFRAGITKLIRGLLDKTDALVVLVGPVVNDVDRVDIGRRALTEMERAAGVFALPVVRTEAALLGEGINPADFRDGEGVLTEKAQGVVVTSVLKLLLQPVQELE